MCPNKFRMCEKKVVPNHIIGLKTKNYEVTSLSCHNGRFFDLTRTPVEVKTVVCDFPPMPKVVKNKDSTKYDIGFSFYDQNVYHFLRIYETYLIPTVDMTSSRLHYTKSVVSKLIQERNWKYERPAPKFSAASYPYTHNMIILDEAYRQQNQQQNLESVLTCYRNPECGNCGFKRGYGLFNRGHLASKSSFMDIYEQISTFYYLNTAP